MTRLFIRYPDPVTGKAMHALLNDDGIMDWSRHPGIGQAVEIPERFWDVPLREVIGYFERGEKVRVKHG